MPDTVLEEKYLDLAVFRVGNITCAVEIREIQEINKNIDVTPVENAPAYIRGMMNLRGNIITIIDMHAVFSMEPLEEIGKDARILVVQSEDEHIGLLVDKMLDVIQASREEIEPPPSNIQGVTGRYFSSIYKMEDSLAGILNLGEILKSEDKR